MKRKTCAECCAYDAEANECHRHPADPWPSVTASDWCMDHMPKRDETGWREDWPDREELLALVTRPEERLTTEAIAEALGTADLTAVTGALGRLRYEGLCKRMGAHWVPIDAKPLAPTAGSLAGLTEPTPPPKPPTAPGTSRILTPYYDKNKAKPYPPSYADPDKIIAACVGGKGMGQIMREMKAAGQPSDLFATMNATKFLIRFGWLVADTPPGADKATYSPGPSAYGLAANDSVATAAAPTGSTPTPMEQLTEPDPDAWKNEPLTEAGYKALDRAFWDSIPMSEAEKISPTAIRAKVLNTLQVDALTHAKEATLALLISGQRPGLDLGRDEIYRDAAGNLWRGSRRVSEPTERNYRPSGGPIFTPLSPEEEQARRERHEKRMKHIDPSDLAELE